MTKALIFGASGYTGQALAPELRGRGIQVVAHVRPGSSQRDRLETEWSKQGISVAAVDWEEEAIRALVREQKPKVVYCLLGTTQERMRSLRKAGAPKGAGSYEEVDKGLTLMAMRACEALSPDAPRVVYLSAMGADKGRGAYMRARKEVEAWLAQSTLDYTSVRPAMITGPDRREHRTGERIAGAVMAAGIATLRALGGGSLADRFANLDAATLAKGMAEAGLHPQSDREILGVADILRLARQE